MRNPITVDFERGAKEHKFHFCIASGVRDLRKGRVKAQQDICEGMHLPDVISRRIALPIKVRMSRRKGDNVIFASTSSLQEIARHLVKVAVLRPAKKHDASSLRDMYLETFLVKRKPSKPDPPRNF